MLLKRPIASLVLIGLIAVGSVFGTIASARQDAHLVDIAANADYIARFSVDFGTPGEAYIRVGTFTIAPGQSSMTLQAAGTLVVSVQAGSLLLIADRPIEGTEIFGDGTAGALLPETSPSALGDGTGSPVPVFGDFPFMGRPHYFEIDAGNGAIIEEGAIVRFTSRSAGPVQMLLIAVLSHATEPAVD